MSDRIKPSTKIRLLTVTRDAFGFVLALYAALIFVALVT